AHSLLTQTFSFLFRSSRDHRALPSFPTRRSSDLPKQLLAFEGKSLLKRITDEALAVSDHPVTVVLGAYHETIAKELSGSKAMIVDRKSTRLNSSHVKISYAVFCLKKKKEKNEKYK